MTCRFNGHGCGAAPTPATVRLWAEFVFSFSLATATATPFDAMIGWCRFLTTSLWLRPLFPILGNA
jgi:hypothetical protein